MNSQILNIQNKIKDCEITKEEILKNTLKKVEENNQICNSFETILKNQNPNEKKGNLEGICYALKDNVSTKSILTTASSDTLKNYIPVYNATVYEKLIDSGATLIGKTTMDEFGLGGSGITGHKGVVKNPWDITRQAGGSSSGSAAVVASGAVPFAIGTDTGDSIRKPAAYCGIVGYKPTYGMISRYGIIPFASSLDHVGVLTNSVLDAAIVVDNIKGKDEKDMTSWNSDSLHLKEAVEKETTAKSLCYIKEITELEYYQNPTDELKQTLELFHNTLEIARTAGFEVHEISIPLEILNAIPATYICISCAEATSNLSNLTGIIFGPRGKSKNPTEMIKEHRTEGLSPLIKRRLIIGSYILQKENQEKYFLNAQRVRNLVVTKIKEQLEQYDALILPCSSGGAKPLEGSFDIITSSNNILENHMVIANFGGFPSITIPNGWINHLPIGINLTSNQKQDEKLLNIAATLEEKINFKNSIEGRK